jgi:sterol desaturase/sphingolipid hydroxylase (fatty acid hydroxylase superfamily)
MWYYTIPLGPMVVLAFWFLPASLFLIHGAVMAGTIWWHIFLHKHYHLRKSWFTRFEWFRRKRALHFIHHRHDQSNFAIVEYVWDRLLGTYHARRPHWKK